jgi:hypothetical protein
VRMGIIALSCFAVRGRAEPVNNFETLTVGI